jgi:hypothetical protein
LAGGIKHRFFQNNQFIDIDKSLRYNYNIIMIEFKWDENKAAINLEKHGVSFEEAQTVFYDEKAQLINDPDHSQDEDRFIILGFSIKLRILVVCHCYREDDSIIRIISARKANKKEQIQYSEALK